MRRLLTFLLAAMAFVACTQNDVEELSANREALPETLTVGFEGDDTRVELNEALKTVWTEGDEVSVFYRSYENTRWAFQGETGDRSGELKLVSGEVGAQTMDNTIVVYPYSDSYAIDADTQAVTTSLPAVQSYKEGSYGAEGNIMVAVGEFTQFSLKSVVGWLRLELTGEGEVVESITVRGNDGEQVAGLCYINAADASIALAESEVDESLVATEVVLNCGDGVELGAETTEFYIALLPQEFAKGITIEVLFNDGSALTKSVDYLLLERNHIAPAALGESKWQVIGEGLYRDDFIGPLYGLPAGTIISVEVAQHIEDKNRYRIIEPYSRDAVIDILGGTPSDMIFTTPGYVEFIVDPTAGTAYIPSSWLGFKLDVTGNGPEDFYLASVYADETTPVYGKYEVDKGIILFPQLHSIMWHFPDGRGYYTNLSGLFAVALKAFTNTWSVVGSFNNWGEAPEIDMTYDEANNIFYATGVEFEADTEFKLRNKWNDSYGSSFYSYIDANSFKTALSDGENIRVKDAGTYDIYFSEDDLLIWLMESGEDRATAVEDFPDGWDGETTSEIRYTSNDGNVITPNNVQAFGIEILSNEYVNGEGVITFAGELTTIGDLAFSGCDSLTSVTIPDSVTTIGESAFGVCNSLISVTIGNSVTMIGELAFQNCSSLTSVTIPDSVTTIGNWAFYACRSLTSVYCKATTPPTLGGSSVFDYNKSGRKIYVPTESAGAYKAAKNWSEYASYIVGYNFETGEEVAISNKLFYTATALVKPYKSSAFNVTIVSNEWDETTGEGIITFDGELTTIGYEAFRDCRSLTSVTIPNSVTAIGDDAFYHCDSLTSVTIPNSVMAIGGFAFCYCSITSITIPDSVISIGDDVFGGCRSLTEFKGKFAEDGGRCLIKDNTIIAYAEASGNTYTIPDSVTTIGDWVFSDCNNLTSVTIPDSVTTIGYHAFRYCDNLTDVTIPDSVTAIGYEAFYDCDSLTSVTIPNSVTSIGKNAFCGCHSLAEFNGKFAEDGGRCLIIDGVLNAFAIGCGVPEYTIPNSVTTIGSRAFDYCRSLISVRIPDSVTAIGDMAFYGCDSLTSVYCEAITPPTLENSSVFDYNKSSRKIYVPAESVEAYKAADGWSEYADYIVGYDFE